MIYETARLIIRKFTTRDLKKLHAILSDKEVMLYSLHGPYSLEQTDTFLKGTLNSYDSRGYAQYAVILKDSKELIGFCGFFSPHTARRVVDTVMDGQKEDSLLTMNTMVEKSKKKN